MRIAFTSAFALLASAAALLHCAASGDPNEPATPGEIEGGGAPASSDAATIPDDAADGGAPSDAAAIAKCSPDHWCPTALPSKDFDLAAVWSFAPDDVIAVGSSGMIHWDGKAWSVVSGGGDAGLDGLTSLWASGPNDLWAAAQGQRRLVHGTRAAGGSFAWTSYESMNAPRRDAVTGGGPNDVWTWGIQDDGTAMLEHVVSGDGGVPSFTPVAIGITPFSMNALYVSANDELWLAGTTDAAAVVHGKKKGANYVWNTDFTTAGMAFTFLTAIWGMTTNEIWVVSATADNYHRSPLADGGASWSGVANHATTSMSSAWGSGKNDVWTVGYYGAIRHWDGTSWSLSQIAVNGFPNYKALLSVHGSSANDIWAVGPGVALHRTPGAGQ